MSAPAQAPSSGASSALRPGAAVVDDDVDSLSSQLSSMGIAPAAGSSRHRESRGPRSGGTGAVAGVGVGAGVVSSPHRTPRVCRYFHSGRCSYGNKCRDLHTEPPATVGSAPQELKQEQQQIAPPGGAPLPQSFDDGHAGAPVSPSRVARPRKSIPCQWHATAEGCRRGDACFYMHEPKDGRTPPRAARPHNQRVPQSEPRQHRGGGAGIAGAMNHAQRPGDSVAGPAGVDVPAGAWFSDPSVGGGSVAAAPLSPMPPLREGQGAAAAARVPRPAPHSAPGPAGRRRGAAGGGEFAVLSPSYLAPSLAAPEAAGFRAAGVFAFHRSSVTGRVSVLFGLEGRSSKNAFHINVLGGKVDQGESALQTASREFWEESGTVFAPSSEQVASRLAQGDVLWYRDAKYALHFLQLSDAEADIDRRYGEQRARKAAEAQAGGAAVIDVHSEMDELLYIDLYVLLRYLNQQLGLPAQGRHSQCGPVATSVGPRPMINFTAAMLNCHEVRERMLAWLEATNGEEGRAQAAEIRAGALSKMNKQRNHTPRKSGPDDSRANGEQVPAAAAAPSDDPAAQAASAPGVAAAPTSAASAGPSAAGNDRV